MREQLPCRSEVTEDNTCLLSCDWGSSSFRLRLLDAPSGEQLAATTSSAGAHKVASAYPDPHERRAAFAASLELAIAGLQREVSRSLAGVPVIASGMVTSSYGWEEVPYATLPFHLDGRNLRPVKPAGTESGRDVFLVGGVCSETDIMRGEECELIGLRAMPSLGPMMAHCHILLPGTHTKIVHVENRQVTGFDTHLTGELYALLLEHSVLKLSLEAQPEAPLDHSAVRQGVRDAAERPLTHALFSIRVRDVLRSENGPAARGYLNGLLLGTELQALSDTDTPLLLAARPRQRDAYLPVLEALGVSSRLVALSEAELNQLVPTGHAAIARTRSIV